MTPENILTIIAIVGAIVGVIAGTGLGYALSMRGKREEWAKEYREKRLAPLIDFVTQFMGTMWQYQFETHLLGLIPQDFEQGQPDEEEMKKRTLLQEAQQNKVRALEQALTLIRSSEVWHGPLAAAELDEQLDFYMQKWIDSAHRYRTQPTDENLEQLMSLARQLLARADEVIIKGWKPPKVKS